MKSLVYVFCWCVCDVIKNNLVEYFIKWLSGSRVVEVMEGFEEYKRVFVVIGVIDGLYILIKVFWECLENYINRKDFYFIVL